MALRSSGEEYGLAYEGLAELGRALKETDQQLLGELREELRLIGDVVADETNTWLETRNPSAAKSAAIDTRVRLGGQGQQVLVVGQSLRSTTGNRPDWGDIQVREMLTIRDRNETKLARMLETGVVRLLKKNGF